MIQFKLYTLDKLSSTIFCCLSVCQASVTPVQISIFSIYTGTKALFWVTHIILGLVDCNIYKRSSQMRCKTVFGVILTHSRSKWGFKSNKMQLVSREGHHIEASFNSWAYRCSSLQSSRYWKTEFMHKYLVKTCTQSFFQN